MGGIAPSQGNAASPQWLLGAGLGKGQAVIDSGEAGKGGWKMGCLFYDFEASCAALSLRQMNVTRMMDEGYDVDDGGKW